MLTAPSTETRSWLDSYYAEVDAMNLDGLVQFFADDARLVFANEEPVAGQAAIRAALGGLFDTIAGIGHDLRRVWEGPDGLVVFEVDVTYDRKDGGQVTVPGAAFSTLRDGRFVDQHIYVDLTPVFA